mmetsp:Transcript_21521/g.51354  ORF Transcript_21521/g.51354 Transcript_21521/m.51354 type:complete len:443 (-) Transcript_21521:157-1485(-)
MSCKRDSYRILFPWMIMLLLSGTEECLAEVPPQKSVPAEAEELCAISIESACGKLPQDFDFVRRPAQAAGLSLDHICSPACKAEVEGINCRGTKYAELAGEVGPHSSGCESLRCFAKIQKPCDLTRERADSGGRPLASCTPACSRALDSEECSEAYTWTKPIHEECSWETCRAMIEADCGDLDFVGAFGIDLERDVHWWLLERSDRLCSRACTEQWAASMDLGESKAQCWKFQKLKEARNYLDEIVCGCYLPAKSGCGDALLSVAKGTEAGVEPGCCSAVDKIRCQVTQRIPFGSQDTHEQRAVGSSSSSGDGGERIAVSKEDIADNARNHSAEGATTMGGQDGYSKHGLLNQTNVVPNASMNISREVDLQAAGGNVVFYDSGDRIGEAVEEIRRICLAGEPRQQHEPTSQPSPSAAGCLPLRAFPHAQALSILLLLYLAAS